MKYIFLYLAATLTLSSFGTGKKCIDARKEAIRDFRKNELKYYVFGIVGAAPDFTRTMKQRYHITVISGGCMVNEYITCYNETADSLIRKKYGDNVAKQVAMRVFAK